MMRQGPANRNAAADIAGAPLRTYNPVERSRGTRWGPQAEARL